MLRFATWKVILVLASTLGAFLLILPSLLPEQARENVATYLPSWLPPKTITLGLDLQGGAHILMEVDKASVEKTLIDNLRDDIRRLVRESKIALVGGINVSGRGIQLRIPEEADRNRLLPKLQNLSRAPAQSLSREENAEIIITQKSEGVLNVYITDSNVREKARRAVDQSIEVLRRRVDPEGTKEVNIQRQGTDRILIEVPGIRDTSALKNLLGQTAKLEYRLVISEKPSAHPEGGTEVLPAVEGGEMVVDKYVLVHGEDLTDAQPGFDPRTNEPVVNFKFNLRGGQQFAKATSENVGRLFAIILDNKIISAPRILSPITGGMGQISGQFTLEQVSNLSILLRAGALPAKLNIVEERTVGPGLGQDSIDAGKRAAYVGTLLVVVFMTISYGLFGIFANIALGIHVMLIFACMVLLGATLTMPGIAGIVLTIGMAVDSNVLIYERIREEAESGRPLLNALDSGFNRAFATIVDSNVTILIAAVLLYLFGSGPVRGFAISLALGILTTIITAVTMTRMMIALWYQYKRPTRLPL